MAELDCGLGDTSKVFPIRLNSYTNVWGEHISVFVCFQGGTESSILAIATTEEKAKEVCCQDDDRYVEMVLDKNYGREPICTDDLATYNIQGKFLPEANAHKQEK